MNKSEEKILVVGMTGSGKSTLVKQLIADRKRVIVFDPQGEYGREGKAVACPDMNRLKGTMDACWDSGFRLSYVPRGGYEAPQLHHLAELLFQVQHGYENGVPGAPPITLVVEEMDLSFPAHNLPADLSGMRAICNQGRHYGIECIGVTQFPTQVHNSFRRNSARRMILRLGETADRIDAAKLLNVSLDDINALEKFEYFEWADGCTEKKRIVQ